VNQAPGARLEARDLPGRVCPTSYRYSPRVFDRQPEIVADTIYVVGGLYGNVEALDALEALVSREPGAAIVFNGDFHWFDVDSHEFDDITRRVLAHHAIRGNVETELACDDSAAGCGCAYPLDVSDAEVSRSNEILERLRATARGLPELRARLGALPMNLVARVGPARVGIVHGDAASLAGWGFAQDRLDEVAHRRWIESAFEQGQVDAFASTHTCLPVFRDFGGRVIANNGAAGMPNFAGERSGLVTRIGVARRGGPDSCFGLEAAGVHVEAITLRYDTARWLERFTRSWPAGSPAHASYFRRIAEGPRYSRSRAAPLPAAA
jgi:hypothetical protein